MSLVKAALEGLVIKGKIDHEFTIHGTKFEMELLSTEEIFLADALVDFKSLKEKYGADERFQIMGDGIVKQRSLSQMTFAIKKVNGQSPVDETLPVEEQFKQRMEFRDELASLEVTIYDQIVDSYNKLVKKRDALFEDLDETAKK
jgi:hypothetical protein